MNFYAILPGEEKKLSGTFSFLHGKREERSSAFLLKEEKSLRLRLPRSLGAVSVSLALFREDGKRLSEYTLDECETDYSFDTFDFALPALCVGLYFLSASVKSVFGVLSLSFSCRRISFLSQGDGEKLQFSISEFLYPEEETHAGGVIYHVFVDRFRKAGKVPCRKDAVLIEDWEHGVPEYPVYPGAHLENNTFFGGTLWGVIEKLDYIASLGVDLIYLSPIFEAYSNHKYDTGDYLTVDEMFGGEEALVRLVAEAKARGIGVILDGVFNHTGDDSRYFNRRGRYETVGAYQSKASPYYSWYEFQHFPDRYTSWWDIPILPRIRTDSEEFRAFIAGDGGVIEKYRALGVSGFRLDVVDELSDDFVESIKARGEKTNPGFLLYGEVWEDASNKIAYGKRKRYYLGTELDGVMNYPLRTGIISFVRDGEPSALRYALTEIVEHAPKRIRDRQMNLIGSHDTERILTVLGGVSRDGKTNEELSRLTLSPEKRKHALEKLKAAFAILFTVPGIPVVYYGDEAGMEGYGDPFNRRPYPWGREDEDLRAFVRSLGKLRKSEKVFEKGDFSLLYLDSDLLVFSRTEQKTAIVTVVNRSDRPVSLLFDHPVKDLLSGRGEKRSEILARSAKIFKTTSTNKFELIK